jgi:ADP-heptose:LPS heptosyltransferase
MLNLRRIFKNGGIVRFAATAAALAQLDLVVAVDTSIVHLAGAMGTRVVVALPYDPDWRWLLDRPDSLWYPRVVTLFRQTSPGDWESVLKPLQAHLRAWAADR